MNPDQLSDNLSKTKFTKIKKNIEPEKKQATTSDLKNRNKSKLSCLIRKKYTKLMKDSIQTQKNFESIVCCRMCRSLTTKLIFKFTSSMFQAFISILAVFLYVAETYMPIDSQPQSLLEYGWTEDYYNTIRSFYDTFEIVIASIVLLDLIYNFFERKNKLKFLYNYLNILDLIIIVSVFLPLIYTDTSVIQNLGFARIFRVIRILRIFRIYKFLQAPRTKNSQDENQNEITRRLASAIMTMGSLLFLSTGIIHYLNENFPAQFQLVVTNNNRVHCYDGTNYLDKNMTTF